MPDCFPQAIAFTRQMEGGYSSDPSDSGNWSGGQVGHGRLIGSKWGVGAPALISWFGARLAPSITAYVMEALPDATYLAIARVRYWRAMGCVGMSGPIAFSVFDFGWNCGDGTSVSVLQSAIGVTEDGDCGRETLNKLALLETPQVLSALDAAQTAHYRSLHNFAEYGAGWLSRTALRNSAAADIPL